jgi:transcriptional regulator with XRE-family HTH domain
MNRILEVIKEKGIKQAELAKQLGCAKSTVSMYCSNTMQPSLSKLIKISELLNCEIGDLLVIKR